MAVIRPGATGDLADINNLYNHYVLQTPITCDIEPVSMDVRYEWFTHYAEHGRHRLLVAIIEGQLVGYTTSSPWRLKRGYETSVETSVYIALDMTGRGLGSRLYTALFEALAGEDLHRAYAGITLPNPASVALHKRFGFTLVGIFTEQGRKLGRYWDVAWYEKPLG